MKFVRRAATTSRPVITHSLWNEIRSQFLQEISQKVLFHSILDELIINADQTPSKFVAADNITMAAKAPWHITRVGSNDKRSVTLIVCESLDNKILPFQLIYKGKTQRSFPVAVFPDGFCLSYIEKHWSNDKETVPLIKKVLVPYIKKFKEEKGLPNDQEKAQSTANVSVKQQIEYVIGPKNMTHMLQPMDLTSNTSIKKIEKITFSKYFSFSIMDALKEDPACDVTKVDLGLSVLKPLHANVMKERYQFFESLKVKEVLSNRWRAAGITEPFGKHARRMKIV